MTHLSRCLILAVALAAIIPIATVHAKRPKRSAAMARPPVTIVSNYERDPSHFLHSHIILSVRSNGLVPNGATNGLQSITITQVRNARVGIPDGPEPTTRVPYTWRATPGRPQTYAPIFVDRQGAGPFFVAFTVVDQYGEWKSFYGAP